MFFSNILEYSGLWPFSVFPRYQCVYTYQAGRTPVLQQNWQSSEKSQYFKEKTQYLMNTQYVFSACMIISRFQGQLSNMGREGGGGEGEDRWEKYLVYTS